MSIHFSNVIPHRCGIQKTDVECQTPHTCFNVQSLLYYYLDSDFSRMTCPVDWVESGDQYSFLGEINPVSLK